MDFMKKFDDLDIKSEKNTYEAVSELYYEKDLGVI